MKLNCRHLPRSALLLLALLVLSACQGAGKNSDGSNALDAQDLLGPVISRVMIPSPSGPAPMSCESGTPALPYAFTDGGDTLMIEGENFQNGARVRVGKERLLAASVVNVAPTSIEVVTPPGSPGNTDVVVVNPDNQAANERSAIRLCARSGATAPGARVVASPSRVQVGDEISVELQVFPGVEDDLRGLRPLLAFDPTGFAQGDRIAGPLPAGADLLVGEPPAVFRYSYLAAGDGEFVLNGTANGINTELGNNVVIGPVLSNIVRVEPLLTSASVDRNSAALDQLIRLTVQVANAGTQTIRHIRGEGTDPDGDAGPIPPEPIPTISGSGALTLQSVSAVIVSGEGECGDDVDPDGETGPLPILPACDLEPQSIARFEYVFRAALPGFVAFEANVASVLTLEPAGTNATRISFSEPPPGQIVARSPWPEVAVEVLDDSGRRMTGFSDPVTLSLGVGTDLIQGTLTATAVEGVARFPGLSYDTAEQIEVTASSATIMGASDTAIVDVQSFGEPAQLVFETPPSEVETVNFPWPRFSVRVLDRYGNLVRNASMPVSVQRSSGTGKFTGLRTQFPELGVVTFPDLRYDTAESMTLRVTAQDLSPLLDIPVDVFANTPERLVFTTAPPATVPAGETWPAFGIAIVDGAGNTPLTNAGPITVSLASGSSTLSGTTMSPAAVKSATFSNLSYDTAESITVDITAPGLTGLTGIPVTIEAVGTVADHLALETMPRAVEVAGESWGAFRLRVEDAGGALVTSANGLLELSLTSGTGAFTGAIAQIVRGVATFDSVTYDTVEMVGFDVVWPAQPGISPVTGLNADVALPGAVQLGFGTTPDPMPEAGTFWKPFTVEIQDASGDRIPNTSVPVSVSLATGSDHLDGKVTVQAINGTATFDSLSYDLVELIGIDIDSPGLMGIGLEPIDVVEATPFRVMTERPPRPIENVDATWAPLSARIVGHDGKLARGLSNTITLSIDSGGGGGTLGGTLDQSAMDGIATFDDIEFDAAAGLRMLYSGTGMYPSLRSFVTVLEAGTIPVRMRFNEPAPSAEAVNGLWQPFSLRIEDDEGRLVTEPMSPVAVTIELTSGTGMLSGTTTRTAVDGIVTFDDLRYDTAENISYDFTSAGLERLFGTARGLSRTIGIITISETP